MRFFDFSVDWVTDGQGGVTAHVRSPAGEGKVLFRLGCSERIGAPVVAPRGPASELSSAELAAVGDELRAVGSELFAALFAGPVQSLFDRSLGKLEAEPAGLRLQLRLDLHEPALVRIYELPWEALYRAAEEHFLALDRRFSVVRYLSLPMPVKAQRFVPPLRILCVAAAPSGQGDLDVVQELDRIRAAWSHLGKLVRVSSLTRATFAGLRAKLLEREFHILHFLGHGDFDPATGEGVLLFEGADGRAVAVRGADLGEQLRDRTSLLGVFLNACWTARADSASPFGGVATALLKAGVPAVIAMQFPIGDRAAATFSGAVYERLARGDSIDAAVASARLAMRLDQPGTWEWATPVLFLRTAELPRVRGVSRRRLWFALGILGGLLLAALSAWVISCLRT